MNHAQGAQRFHQGQLPIIELAELFVASEQGPAQVRRPGAPVAHEHPKVLHRGAIDCVVEVHEMWACVGPKDIARVTIAVQPNH